mgnify:FL=1
MIRLAVPARRAVRRAGFTVDLPLTRLSEAARLRVEQQLQRYAFRAGAPVVHRGQTVNGAYLVLKGRLRVYTVKPSGAEATLYHLTAGETCILAINALFNDLLYPAWVAAEADTVVGIIPGGLYRNLFQAEEAIQDLTVKSLSTLVFRLMDELEQVHSLRLDQRLSAHLLERANGQGVVTETQARIAGQLGSSREVVARILADMASRGWIETGRGRIRLVDTTRLAQMTRPGG